LRKDKVPTCQNGHCHTMYMSIQISIDHLLCFEEAFMNIPWRIFLVSFSFLFTFGLLTHEANGLGTPSIELGSNPVFNYAGSGYVTSTGFSQLIATAPSSMDMRITDIQLSSCCDNNAYGSNVTLTTSSGTVIGRWSVNRNTSIITSMESGLIVPAGESITLTAQRNNYSVYIYYTFSGQYVRP
jgi:hypothetical protein